MKATRTCAVFGLFCLMVAAVRPVAADTDEPSVAADTNEPLVLAEPAAKEDNQPWEKGSVRFGGMLAGFNSGVGFGLKQFAGITIDAEDALKLDSTLLVWSVDALFRYTENRRHQLDFTYASYNRQARTVLREEIEIDGEILPAGTRIRSEFDFDIIRGGYSYAFFQDDRIRLSLGVGVYVLPIRYGIDIIQVGDPRKLDIRDFTLPLPSLALRMEFLIVPKVYLMSELYGMYLNIGNFEGSIMDATLGVEYRPWKHLGFGLAYHGLDAHVEVDSRSSDYPGADFVGSVDVEFSGLVLFARLLF